MDPDWLTCLACAPHATARLNEDPALAARWIALPRRRLSPGQCLHPAGQPVRASWFVEEGLVRSVVRDTRGRERNTGFHAECSWIGAGVPPYPAVSVAGIEAIEASRVVELGHGELQAWLAEMSAVGDMLADALRFAFARQAAREAELLLLTATQRYQAFVSNQPALAARLPQHQLAIYLGVTDVGLSRIRARLGLTPAGRARRGAG
ncbi:Crp/Fnr family transcriptional regulator [Piscinibacter sp.]|uniref:Crp/Fnr family transcriptional regulator n=1 Tax=Piscinibacter sp. TaxID=1903157 RepID=UPI002C25E0C9|nr:Crp/Fnr family transcriptional regulator [Albitalea sp.]HUG26567.1 Crp/Fnr family transcriptional regulator [Albitalea sp.]